MLRPVSKPRLGTSAPSHCRLAAAILISAGLLMLWAAIQKAIQPYETRAAFSLVMAEFVFQGSSIGRAWTNAAMLALVLMEATIGVLLIARASPRTVSVVFAAMMAGFCLFLAAMLLMPEAPSCSCLGQWPGSILDARDAAVLGIVRNAALGTAVLWGRFMIRSERSGPSLSTIFSARPRTRRGVTLLELLVAIAVIAVLIAILLPSVSAVRKSSRQAGVLSDLRQWAAAAVLYSGQWGDAFPTAHHPHAADMPDVFGPGGPLISPNGYLSQNARDWGTPLQNDGHDGPGAYSTDHFLLMTSAAFAVPDIFEDDRVPIREELRTQRFSSVRYPSAKGLLLSTHPDFWPEPGTDFGPLMSARVDGSASFRATDPRARPAPDSLVYGFPFPTVWTRRGVLGKDFE